MDPRLQAGVELQLEKQAQQAHNSSLSGVLGQYFKQGAEGKSPITEEAKKQTKKNKTEFYTGQQEEAQERADTDPILTGGGDRVQAQLQTDEQRKIFAEQQHQDALAAAAAAEAAVPPSTTTGPGDRVQAQLQTDEQRRIFAEQQHQDALAAQQKLDDAISLPAVSDRDKLMASLPPHLQTEPKPGTPDWDYWNKMVQLHIKRQDRTGVRSWFQSP